MKTLIIGLGNPGGRFDGTRHNVGFMVVDELARQADIEWREKAAWCAEVAELPDGILLAKPTTFMNDSGRAVQALANYFDVTGDHVCVVYDDRDLPFGTLRWTKGIRTGAHHNGLRSVMETHGTEIIRLRVGIANALMANQNLKDFVLHQFSSSEKKELPEIVTRAVRELRRELGF